jgi:predicted amidohydrolase
MLVAAAQVAPRPDHPDDTAPIEAAIRHAAAQGAQLVVLPELAVTGYAPRHFDVERAGQETLSGPTVTTLLDLSAELRMVVVCGVPEHDEDRWWNSAVVLDSGRLVGHYRKVHLWGPEKEWVTAADQPPLVVDTSIGRVGTMICYDLEFPEWVRLAAEAGAEILAVPANWPRFDHPGRHPVEVAKAQAAAATYGLAVAVADRCGEEDGIDWEGGTLICDARGYLIAGPATAPGQTAEPTVLLGEVDLSSSRDKARGRHNDVLGDRRPHLYTTPPRAVDVGARGMGSASTRKES